MDATTNITNKPVIEPWESPCVLVSTVKLLPIKCSGAAEHGELVEIEEIHKRAETITTLLEEILNLRSGSHWDFNE